MIIIMYSMLVREGYATGYKKYLFFFLSVKFTILITGLIKLKSIRCGPTDAF